MQPATIRPFLFGVLAVLLAWLGQRALRADALVDAALLYGAGVLLFVAALRRPLFGPERAWVFPTAALPSRRSRRWWLAGGLLLGALVLATLSLNSFDAGHPASTAAWLQHIASVILALAATLCADGARGRRSGRRSFAAKAARILSPDLLPLLAILLLAAVLRLVWLDLLPFGVWYDEAEYGLQAKRILENPEFRPVFEGAIHGPAHYLYLVALSFDRFGVSVQSIRLVNAAFGVLTALAGFWVGRELFDRRIGLVLAFLLAVSSWSVTLSRLGMHSTSTTPFFTLATLAFLLAGLRTGKLLHFALAGLWLGLGLNFYTSFRLFVPVTGLFLLHMAACQWWRTRRGDMGTRSQWRFWLGVAALGLMAALVVAPVVWFALKQPDIFWARVQDTYIFTGKSEGERLPALLGNIRKHLMMFNWHGDPNGRHNLPGAPMLDDIAGMLMVLGLGYSLWRSRDPRYALLPLWLGLTLLGGILSLDFEAPQSLRANGALGAAYVLAVAPLAVLVRAWETSDGRWLRGWVWWPVALLLAAAAFANIRVYFDRWANDFSAWAAHSTAETLTANLLAGLDENTDAFVTSFFHGHPTLRFLLPASRPFTRLETTDKLPLNFTPGKGALLVMNIDSRAQFEAAKALYPTGQFEEVMPPMAGPPVLFTSRLSPEDVASIQGLDGSYYANADWAGPPALVRREAALDFDWAAAPPLPEPFSAEWNGVLHVGAYGVHDLVLQSPGYAELLIGEQRVLTGTGVLSGSLTLAAGNHALRVRAVGAPGVLQLRWLPPDRPLELVGAGSLYAAPMTANGLLARYFSNGEWQEPEISARIEDQLGYYVHVPPLPRPYTVEYSGKIAIPAPGHYHFGLESIDDSTLAINGQEVVRSTLPNEYAEGVIALDAGLHDIRIRFADHTDYTHLNVYWMPPGATRAIIPAGVLFPPQGSYANVQLPSLDSVVAVAPLVGPAPPAPQMAGTAEVFAEGLQQPRGIAVAEDGHIYVAAGSGGKVTVFSPDGEIEGLLPPGSGRFVEPTDLAVDGQSLYVADGGAGELWRYTLDGAEAVTLPIDRQLVDRARGLAVGPDGRLWLAATSASVIAGVSTDGEQIVRIPVTAGGAPGQPSDVAAGADGALYATDTAAGKLLRMSGTGQTERSWNVPSANSLDSPHLAFDLFGNLYITDPEGGRVEQRDASGEAVGAWDLNALLDRRVKAVGLAVGPDGRIWVTDSEGGAVIVIEPE